MFERSQYLCSKRCTVGVSVERVDQPSSAPPRRLALNARLLLLFHHDSHFSNQVCGFYPTDKIGIVGQVVSVQHQSDQAPPRLFSGGCPVFVSLTIRMEVDQPSGLVFDPPLARFPFD